MAWQYAPRAMFLPPLRGSKSLFPLDRGFRLRLAALRFTHGCDPAAANAAVLSVSKDGPGVKSEHPMEWWNCHSLAFRNSPASSGNYETHKNNLTLMEGRPPTMLCSMCLKAKPAAFTTVRTIS